jgi:site-specific recombinase XerD
MVGHGDPDDGQALTDSRVITWINCSPSSSTFEFPCGEDVGIHTLRHSAAVDWLEAGVHIKAVADPLGHSSIAITGDVYGHTSDDTARAAIDGRAGRLGL